MKTALLIIGCIVAIVGLLQTLRCLVYLQSLNEYGKGYLAGSVVLMIVGVGLIVMSRRKRRTS